MPSSRSSVDTRDIYYRLTKSSNYRARSAFKLLHLDEEFDLFTGVRNGVDLCAAPGSWSQVLGEKLKPGKGENDPRVVSIDLQPMAPLPNTTILQTDITLPSTIPLVLNALGGRKADLVVCDGAPDVTGVHDLDAYLHSQLLLAALTLSLTLLAPGSTLIFKIFLSPLDPQGAILRSQLQPFFVGPTSDEGAYEEFDEAEVEGTNGGIPSEQIQERKNGDSGLVHDEVGRRGGVWVRKPRSSRKGSGEAFIICRNFNPSAVPLPTTFSPEALDGLAQQTAGTLTLESLATLVPSNVGSLKEWEVIKAYVGGGDLKGPDDHGLIIPPPLAPKPPGGREKPVVPLEIRIPPCNGSGGKSPVLLQADPTPLDGPSDLEYFVPVATANQHLHPDHSPTNPSRLSKGVGLGLSDNSQSSLDTPPNSASTSNSTFPRLNTNLFGHINERDIIRNTPEISPALSTSSKNDLFFSSPNPNLPTPPKPIANSTSLGRGWPSSLREKGQDRASSLPTQTPTKEPHSRTSSVHLTPYESGPSVRTNSPLGSRILTDQLPSTPLSSYPTFPKIHGTPTPPRPRPANHQRRESHISRESREAPIDFTTVPLEPGEVLQPIYDPDLPESRSKEPNWRLIMRLGEGAFSSVWRGESMVETKSSRCVAIKLTSNTTTRQNARTRIAFLRECSVLRHISHPNIVSFVEAFSTVAYCVLVIEELRGGELWELVGDVGNRRCMGLRDPEEAEGVDGVGEGFVRRIIGELCRAVGWLHRVGVVHRDIKLENILFTTNPFSLPPTSTGSIPLDQLPKPLIKLTDFGLSRFVNPQSPLLETRCGSESFAAPEIIMGRPYDGRLTDAWAVGVVLFGLICGELPFDSPTQEEGREERKKRMMRIARGRYSWRDGVGGEGVRRVVRGLLERDVRERWGVERVWEDEWMSGVGGVARPEEVWCMEGMRSEVEQGNKGRRKVLDGYLLEEEVGDVARSEMEL